MFLGWYDPDRRKSTERKLDDAIARYRAKFGLEPEAVLTSVADAADLGAAAEERQLVLKGVNFIPRSTFYIGVEDAPAGENGERAA